MTSLLSPGSELGKPPPWLEVPKPAIVLKSPNTAFQIESDRYACLAKGITLPQATTMVDISKEKEELAKLDEELVLLQEVTREKLREAGTDNSRTESIGEENHKTERAGFSEETLLLEQALSEYQAVVGNITKLQIADSGAIDAINPSITALRRDTYNTREIDPRPVIKAADDISAALIPQIINIQKESELMGVGGRQTAERILTILTLVRSITDPTKKAQLLQQAMGHFQSTIEAVESSRLQQRKQRSDVQTNLNLNVNRPQRIHSAAGAYLGRLPSQESAPGVYALKSNQALNKWRLEHEKLSALEDLMLKDNRLRQKTFKEIAGRITRKTAEASAEVTSEEVKSNTVV